MTNNTLYPITDNHALEITPAEARALLARIERTRVRHRQALFHRGLDASARLVAAAWFDEPFDEEPQQ